MELMMLLYQKVNLKHLREQKETVSIKDNDREEDATPPKENEQDELIVKGHSVSSNIFETIFYQ